ncbi:hypothetical protein QE152_g13526 [Popillia japonica]|uniref:Endonuclease/exonuclease/phosphatase domain-containing protein n=1 Tax=Popillia japonica TaxID=7064 RepID=A0AAW1LCR4_POPJA
MERCDTENNRTGGVLMFVKKEYKPKLYYKKHIPNTVWILAIQVQIGKIKYLLTTLYRSPSCNDNEFLNTFEEFLENIIDFNGTQIICGDFNYDLMKEEFYTKKCNEIILQYGLKQLVNECTRITPYSSTLIDYVVSNDKNLKIKICHTPKISDHSFVSINVDNSNQNMQYEVHKYRNYKNYNKTHLQDTLLANEWNNNGNVNQMANDFVTSISTIMNDMCPITEIKILHQHANKKWITGHVLELMKRRDEKYKAAIIYDRPAEWEQYRATRNEVVKTIRSEKEQYFRNILDSNKTNSTKLWKNLKTVLPNNTNGGPHEHIKFGNKMVSGKTIADYFNRYFVNGKTIADYFNRYFVNSVNEIIQSTKKFNDHEVILNNISEHNKMESFTKLNMSDLRCFVKSLKKSVNLESGITTNTLMDSFEVVGNRLLDIINGSLETGVFPETWKISKSYG